MLSTESLVKMGKWSEGDQWEVDRDGAREDSENVITRSRIFFFFCEQENQCVELD